MTATWSTSGTQGERLDHARTQIPQLIWAWTIWKAKGQTMPGLLVLDLGDSEKEHGLAYTAIYRATKTTNIGIINPFT